MTKSGKKSIEPWVSFKATEIMDKFLSKSMYGFEWGSGRSTIWLAKHTEKLVSLEHNDNWYACVQRWIKDNKIENVRHVFEPNMQEYTSFINQFPEEEFDYIFIDGRDRNDCIKNALPRLKNNGILILDNSDREWYNEGVKHIPVEWSKVVVTGIGLSGGLGCLKNDFHTTFWFKETHND